MKRFTAGYVAEPGIKPSDEVTATTGIFYKTIPPGLSRLMSRFNQSGLHKIQYKAPKKKGEIPLVELLLVLNILCVVGATKTQLMTFHSLSRAHWINVTQDNHKIHCLSN